MWPETSRVILEYSRELAIVLIIKIIKVSQLFARVSINFNYVLGPKDKKNYSRKCKSVFFHFPKEVHDEVHGAAVVELLFELHALTRHLDAHEHVQETRY